MSKVRRLDVVRDGVRDASRHGSREEKLAARKKLAAYGEKI